MDISASLDKVYSVGGGTFLDAQILTFVRSRGWQERMQVAYSLQGLMGTLEERYIYRVQQQAEKDKQAEEAGSTRKVEKERVLNFDAPKVKSVNFFTWKPFVYTLP